MYLARVIPVLLISQGGLVKTRKFKDPIYVGDPVNAVRIFNEKEVDELVVLDIDASKNNQEIDFDLLEELASECFMPLAYGGGIKSVDQVKRLIRGGVEKVVINSAAADSFGIISDAARIFGSQAIIAGVDVKKNLFNRHKIYRKSATEEIKADLAEYVQKLESAGAGEILLNSIDGDGMMQGYDIDLIRLVSSVVKIPVIAAGGAATTGHLKEALEIGGAGAVAAGSMFVFRGKHRAVLIGYLSDAQKKELMIRIN